MAVSRPKVRLRRPSVDSDEGLNLSSTLGTLSTSLQAACQREAYHTVVLETEIPQFRSEKLGSEQGLALAISREEHRFAAENEEFLSKEYRTVGL